MRFTLSTRLCPCPTVTFISTDVVSAAWPSAPSTSFSCTTHYHMMRAASKCNVCGRGFRSVGALTRHVEETHLETMSEEEIQQFRSNLAVATPLGLLNPGNVDLEDEQLLEEEAMETDNIDDSVDSGEASGNTKDYEYLNKQALAEDSYNDASRKYRCHRCKVAFAKQSYLSLHNRTSMHRRGDKFVYPMEKYMDPNRPFKCETCMESFTQKNILLVHYNSVSHLHKLKQQQQDGKSAAPSSSVMTSPSSTSSSPIVTTSGSSSSAAAMDPKKPYKCNICKVSYSQGTTLEIHMRSVLHQSRAAKLQELVMTGQVDPAQPLIEQPDMTALQQKPSSGSDAITPLKAPKVSAMPLQSVSQASSARATPSTPQPLTRSGATTPTTKTSPVNGVPQQERMSSTPVIKAEPSTEENKPVYACQRCNSMFNSQGDSDSTSTSYLLRRS